MGGENLVLTLGSKMLLTNQISVFFNCHYLINGLTSDSSVVHVDRHE